MRVTVLLTKKFLMFTGPINRAIVFLKDLGIQLEHRTLYGLWRLPHEMRFRIGEDVEQKLMLLCPIHKRVPLNDLLDNKTVLIDILPLFD